MEIVKLSSFDRLVNLHQSLELNHTKKINKKILQEQVYQNAELQYLNKQLNTANHYNRQILENQIRDIEYKETQKFYKNLSFKMYSLVECLDNISDVLVKKYFVDRQVEQIKSNITIASTYLDEINDKVFNQNLLTRIDLIKATCDIEVNDYNTSPFSVIDGLIEQIKIKRSAIAKFKKPPFKDQVITDKSKTNIVRLLGLLIFGIMSFLILIGIASALVSGPLNGVSFGLILLSIVGIPFTLILIKDLKWRRSYPLYLKSQTELREKELIRKINADNDYQMKLDELNNNLLNHPAFQTYEQIVTEHPEFEMVIEKLDIQL